MRSLLGNAEYLRANQASPLLLSVSRFPGFSARRFQFPLMLLPIVLPTPLMGRDTQHANVLDSVSSGALFEVGATCAKSFENCCAVSLVKGPRNCAASHAASTPFAVIASRIGEKMNYLALSPAETLSKMKLWLHLVRKMQCYRCPSLLPRPQRPHRP